MAFSDYTLGEYIRKTRKEKGIALTELASSIRKTPPFLHDIEMDRRHPSDEVLELIAINLGQTLDELKKNDTRPPVKDVRDLATDPQYAFAFRKIIESGMTPHQMLDAVENIEKQKARSHEGDTN